MSIRWAIKAHLVGEFSKLSHLHWGFVHGPSFTDAGCENVKWKSWKDARRRVVVAWFYGSRRAVVQVIFTVIDNTMISLSYPTPDLLGAMLMSNFTVIVHTIFSARCPQYLGTVGKHILLWFFRGWRCNIPCRPQILWGGVVFLQGHFLGLKNDATTNPVDEMKNVLNQELQDVITTYGAVGVGSDFRWKKQWHIFDVEIQNAWRMPYYVRSYWVHWVLTGLHLPRALQVVLTFQFDSNSNWKGAVINPCNYANCVRLRYVPSP